VHGRVLAFLTALFALRIFGQILVEFFNVRWLPPSDAWASGLIPYPILLAIQLGMLVGMLKIVLDVSRECGYFAVKRPSRARFLIGFSAVYAVAMALRYVLTMIFFPEMRWLGGAIPIFFHFVLAAFLFTWGRFHRCAGLFARPDPA
jgi:hypothetical protein